MDVVEKAITCPHCGGHFMHTVDPSNGEQEYYEDCPDCCNAIHLRLVIDEARNKLRLYVDADDEQVY